MNSVELNLVLLTNLFKWGKELIEKANSLSKISEIHWLVEPLISIIPRSVANSTALSIWVILSELIHTSRVIGWAGRVGTGRRNLEGPNSISRETVKRKLTKLAL